jgi:hypothetical protein
MTRTRTPYSREMPGTMSFQMNPFFSKTRKNPRPILQRPSSSSAAVWRQCRCLEGFDLVSSTHNQAAFLWQVSGPKFREDAFLHEAMKNYHKFLQLSSNGEKRLPLVPTYQIDLMWHTLCFYSVSVPVHVLGFSRILVVYCTFADY